MLQVPDLEAVLVAVSGGGMIAGIATVLRELSPKCKGKHYTPAIIELTVHYVHMFAKSLRTARHWRSLNRLGREFRPDMASKRCQARLYTYTYILPNCENY